jgi:hypothetical protein
MRSRSNHAYRKILLVPLRPPSACIPEGVDHYTKLFWRVFAGGIRALRSCMSRIHQETFSHNIIRLRAERRQQVHMLARSHGLIPGEPA